jgi:hypothetical protein
MSSEEGGKGHLYTSKTFNLASDRYGGCALTVNIYEHTCTYLERSVHLLLSERSIGYVVFVLLILWGRGGIFELWVVNVQSTVDEI